MSALASAAVVTIQIADFVNNDPGGKSNVLGSGVAVLGFDVQSAVTARFSVLISAHLPSALLPAEFPIEISLQDSRGELVELPGSVPGQPQFFRVAQLVQIDRPAIQYPVTIRDHIGGRHQVALDFGNGLPLNLGGLYRWHVRIDGDDSVEWSYAFAVVGTQPGVIVG